MISSTAGHTTDPSAHGIQHAAGGYGPPGGGYPRRAVATADLRAAAPRRAAVATADLRRRRPAGRRLRRTSAAAASADRLRAAASAAADPGFGPAGGFPPPGGPMMPGAGGDVNTTLPLILNIVGALFCGGTCVGFILAIVGIVFAVQAGNAKGSGDIMTAKAKAKTSMLMFIITAVLGVLGAIAYTLLFVLLDH